ncbi:hypothetical protein MTR67_012131 [Solanum verrucosum]|uniref:Uncharacterized protein n=1 Tax=Solanum verrucosum TaxID=315347 RepID=A0AAF0QDY1_SOLVR|nr:hypothetical protein MTR67_012131 [Solanum verrucosum]
MSKKIRQVLWAGGWRTAPLTAPEKVLCSFGPGALCHSMRPTFPSIVQNRREPITWSEIVDFNDCVTTCGLLEFPTQGNRALFLPEGISDHFPAKVTLSEIWNLKLVNRVMEALAHFSAATGLEENMEKSSVVLAEVDEDTRN